MRICHVTNVHGPFDGRIFYKMAGTAKKYGHEVFLIAPHCKHETKNGIEIIPIKKPKNRIKRFVESFRIIKIAKVLNADIYQFHDVELIPVMLKIKRN